MTNAIKRKQINSQNTFFEEIWQLYTTTFPISERRDEKQQKELLNTSNYHCEALLYNDSLFGFLFWWDFPKSCFIEHFAIFPKFRNQGLGRETLLNFQKESTKSIILEVERPLDRISKRRTEFYKRLDFHINTIDYKQPPYRKEETAVPMLLCSYPKILTTKDWERLQNVYLPQIYPLYK